MDAITSAGSMDSFELINTWARNNKTLMNLIRDQGLIEYELQSRMELDGATEIKHPNHEVRLKERRAGYDQKKLAPIKEYVSNRDLEGGGALIPRHQEWVEDTWNMTKLKRFARLHKDIKDIIDEAREEPGRARLSIKRKG